MSDTGRESTKAWRGLPVFQCRWCRFERVNRLDTVEAHERSAHRKELQSLAVTERIGAAVAVGAPVQEQPAPAAPATETRSERRRRTREAATPDAPPADDTTPAEGPTQAAATDPQE